MRSHPCAGRRRTPRLEALEDKALLSTVTIYPFGHPDQSRTIVVPGDGGGGNPGTAPATGTGAASGVGAVGQGSGSANNHGNTSGGSTSGAAPAVPGAVLLEGFHRRGGHARYHLLEAVGSHTYASTFRFDVHRHGSHPASASVTAASAFNLLVNRVVAVLSPGTAPPSSGATPSAGAYTVERHRLFAGRTDTIYDLTIRSGGVVISEHYRLTESSSGLSASSNTFTKSNAFADFVGGFAAEAASSGVGAGTF